MKFGYLLLLVCATLASPALAVEDTAASCEADGSCVGEAEEEALLQTRAASQAGQNLSRAEGRSSVPCETILCETDTQGDNMDQNPAHVGSYDECRGLCTSTDGCVGWTWKVFESSQGSHECWLKRANGASKTDSDSVSGTCDGPPPPEACGQPRCRWTTNGHNMGGISNGQIMGSYEACKKACGETPGCQHWTWKTQRPTECWLKDGDDGAQPAEDEISVSGYCSSTPTPTPPTPSPPPTPPTPPTPPARCGEPLCKYDTQGQNMGGDNGKIVGSYDDCLKRCSETPGCKHWTWKTESPEQCWLKDGPNGNQPKDDDISVSGYCPELSSTPQRPSECGPRLCETSTEGHNMEKSPPHTDSEDECRELCSKTPDCKSWTWKTTPTSSGEHQCWLKDGELSFNEITDKHSVSGYCH